MNILDFAAKASYLGSAGLLFLETGALIGMVIPGGDSLVLALGVLAAMGHLKFGLLWLLLIMATTLGQWAGYYWGHRSGGSLLRRVDKDKLSKARYFLKRYGSFAFLLSPFLPVVRTLMPFLAGAGGVPAGRYALWSAVAAALWITSTLSVGYFATNWALILLH